MNLPFPLPGTIEWFDEAEAWFNVNERRSNETVDPDKLVPEIERNCLVHVSQHEKCSLWDGQTCVQNKKEIHEYRGTKQERTSEHERLNTDREYERWI